MLKRFRQKSKQVVKDNLSNLIIGALQQVPERLSLVSGHISSAVPIDMELYSGPVNASVCPGIQLMLSLSKLLERQHERSPQIWSRELWKHTFGQSGAKYPSKR